MITVSINEQPLIDAKNFAVDTGTAVKEKFNEVKEKAGAVACHVKSMINFSPSKAAYYSSIAANLSSYMFGFDSLSNIVFTGTEIGSLNIHVKQAEKGDISPEDKKLANTARANLAINVFTSVFNIPTAKLALTAYNCMSDHVAVSVKA